MKESYKTFRDGYLRLRGVTHPLRLKMLETIDSHKEISVTTLYKELKLEQSVTSQHLKILRDASVVKSRRDGKQIFYSVNHENLSKYLDLANQLIAIT